MNAGSTANTTFQPPYYQTLQMPGQDAPSFSLSSSFITGGTSDRNVMTGYLAVDAEAGNTAGKVSDGYAKRWLSPVCSTMCWASSPYKASASTLTRTR